MNSDEGEQDTHFMPLPPQQSYGQIVISTNLVSESSSELDVLYRQISECLDQWPARKSQNYFELKHHFELLHVLRNENYKGEAYALISKRAKDVLAASKTSWSFVKKSTVSGDLHELGYCVDPPKISFRQTRPFRRGSRLGMRGPVIRRKSQQISHEGKI